MCGGRGLFQLVRGRGLRYEAGPHLRHELSKKTILLSNRY
jgi:hypothetical protein